MSDSRTAKPLILLIGSGSRTYRGSLVTELAETYDVWLLDREIPSWLHCFTVGSTAVGTWSLSELAAAAHMAELAVGRKIDGVLCWEESLIIAASSLAEALALPGPSREASRACRDKIATRTLLTKVGLRQPAFRHCSSVAEANDFAATYGFPVIVKPRAGAGSIGVAKVSSAAELEQRLAAARVGRHLSGSDSDALDAVIETYVEGPEISVDGMVVDGAYTPLYTARKTTGLAPHFEELGHLVEQDTLRPEAETLAPLLQAAHQAIQFKNGMTHTEVLLNPDGPVIVEINGRFGGDFLPRLAYLAFGIKPVTIAAAIACGVRPAITYTRSAIATVQFVYPTSSGRLHALDIPESREGEEGYFAEIIPLARLDELLQLPPAGHMNRIAAVIVAGKARERVCAVAEMLTKSVVFEMGSE